MNEHPDDSALIRSAAAGDGAALGALWQRHRPRLRQMFQLRLDRPLRRRVDPSDVLQEAYIDLADRLPDYARERPMPISLWIRLVTARRLMQVHRRHLGTAQRDVGREVSLHPRAGPKPARRRSRRSSWAASPAPAGRPPGLSSDSGSSRR
jgi:RNA polymerase sigma-70 factor (ECF subfamily)